jgi:serine/threonine-protein kinase
VSLASGATFGAYRIIEPLGRGGMASVYRAYEAALDRYIALKVLPGEFLHDESFGERFRREAKVVARLEHPNIIPIHAFGIEGGIPWMAMRLISGGTLSSLLRSGRLTHERIITILRGTANALDYAHGKGVVHRDVKPQNILLDEAERVYLADFGIAKMVEGTGALTQTGMITGTPQYMAPEQGTGQPVDQRADIYALGVVAFEMLTGRVPFAADTPVAVLMKHMTEPIPIPSASDVPEPLARALLKCLAKRPEDRWPTAGAFAGALEGRPTLAMAPATGLISTIADAPGPTSGIRPPAPPTVPPSPATLRPRGSAGGAPAGGTVRDPPPRGRAGLVLGAGALLLLLLVAAFLLLRRPGPSSTTSVETRTPVASSTATPPTTMASALPVSGGAGEERDSRPSPAPDAGVSSTARATSPAGHTTPGSSPTATTAPASPSSATAVKPRPAQPSAAAPVVADAGPAPAASPFAAAPPVATASLRLDVDAYQDGQTNSAGTLYITVLVDGHPMREFSLTFEGRDAFARQRRQMAIELAGVPVGRRSVTVRASTDRGEGNPVQGSADVQIDEGANRAYVQVRYMSPTDRAVRLR